MLRAAYIAACAAVLFVLCLRWARSKRQVRVDEQRWSSITPGPMVCGLAAATTAFSLLLFYVWLFVGSSRSDADEEMLYCLLTALGFLTLSFLLVLSASWRRIQWRDHTLRVTPLLGRKAVYQFDELQAVILRQRAGVFVLHFSAHGKVKLSVLMNGTRELLVSLGNPEVAYVD